MFDCCYVWLMFLLYACCLVGAIRSSCWGQIPRYGQGPGAEPRLLELRFLFQSPESLLVLHFFFNSGGRRRHSKMNFKTFQSYWIFFIENHWRHQYVRSFMANCHQMHSPLPGLVPRVLICPRFDPRQHLDRPQCTLFDVVIIVKVTIIFLHLLVQVLRVCMYECYMLIWDD